MEHQTHLWCDIKILFMRVVWFGFEADLSSLCLNPNLWEAKEL